MFEANIVYILLLTIIALIYAYVKYSYSYWRRYGVPQLEPKFPFGNFTSTFLLKMSMGDVAAQIYNSSVEPLIGLYTILKPTLLVRDPVLINSILINDFQYFMGRGVYSNDKRDPLSGHLFALESEKWKKLRAKLSPTFTPTKTKQMFPIIVKTAKILERYINKIVDDINNNNVEKNNQIITNGLVDMKEILSRFTTDIIASVGFGIEVNSVENPDAEFRNIGRQIFNLTFWNGIRFLMFNIWPPFFDIFRLKMFDQSVEDFMNKVVKDNLEYRKKNNISRQDYFQNLIDLYSNDDSVNINMVHEEITSQTFIFFIAGFETTSSTMTFVMYLMAKHTDVQKKVQEEIDQVLMKHNGNLTFEAVSEMIYMDWCIDESLRMYPVISILTRIATQSYQLKNNNVHIEKGTKVIISPLALHRDPKYFPNPNEFIPERFKPENVKDKTFTEMPYLPFGIGPKNCIGQRLGKLQLKIGLIGLLQNFKYNLEPNEPDPEFSPFTFPLSPKRTILFKVTKR